MNRCERYADWISDAAAGELAPGRKPELLAHAAECDACRESYQHAGELAALVDRGIESLVSGDPSPHFAARLRARIAAQPAPVRLSWLGWKPIAAAGIGAVLAAVAIVSHAPPRRTDELAARLEAKARSGSSAATTQPRAGRHYHSGAGHKDDSIQAVSHRPRIQRNVSTTSQPEVIVPPGQIEAIFQFADAVRSGRIDGKQLLATQQNLDKPLEIEPLDIAPLGPLQPDVSSNDPNGGHP